MPGSRSSRSWRYGLLRTRGLSAVRVARTNCAIEVVLHEEQARRRRGGDFFGFSSEPARDGWLTARSSASAATAWCALQGDAAAGDSGADGPNARPLRPSVTLVARVEREDLADGGAAQRVDAALPRHVGCRCELASSACTGGGARRLPPTPHERRRLPSRRRRCSRARARSVLLRRRTRRSEEMTGSASRRPTRKGRPTTRERRRRGGGGGEGEPRGDDGARGGAGVDAGATFGGARRI